MNKTRKDWDLLLREAHAEVPVVLNRMALRIFPAEASVDISPRRLGACVLRNLLAYMIHLCIQKYLATDLEYYPDTLGRYLRNLHHWLRHTSNPRFFIGQQNLPVTQEEADLIFKEAEGVPAPPNYCQSGIRQSYTMSRKILSSPVWDEPQFYRELYQFSGEWAERLLSPEMQIFPIQEPLKFAGKHIALHLHRIDNHSGKSIVWGKEIYDQIQKYLSKGLCRRTAKARAQQDFLKRHPYQPNSNEAHGAYPTPGRSRPALTRYLNKYLESQSQLEKK